MSATQPPIRLIVDAVSAAFDVKVVDIMAQRRTAEMIAPRFACYWLAKTLTNRSLATIGRQIGGRDHTTVLHGIRQAEQRLKDDPEFAAKVAAAETAIHTLNIPRIAKSYQDRDVSALAHEALANPRICNDLAVAKVRAFAERVLAGNELAEASRRMADVVSALIGGAVDEREKRRLFVDLRSVILPEVEAALEGLGFPKEENENVATASA